MRRFWSQVKFQPGECWLWTGQTTPAGYGQIFMGSNLLREKRSRLNVWAHAHRVSWKLFRGPIPNDFDITHTCGVRTCVNPNHLEAISMRENRRRAAARSAQVQARRYCPRGHEYTPDNTYLSVNHKRGTTHRQCRACRRLRQGSKHKEKREQQ